MLNNPDSELDPLSAFDGTLIGILCSLMVRDLKVKLTLFV